MFRALLRYGTTVTHFFGTDEFRSRIDWKNSESGNKYNDLSWFMFNCSHRHVNVLLKL